MGSILSVIISVVVLTFLRGKEEGRWGCFIAVIAFFLILVFVAEIRG